MVRGTLLEKIIAEHTLKEGRERTVQASWARAWGAPAMVRDSSVTTVDCQGDSH